MENFNIVWHYKDLLLKGLGYTVFVSVAAILIALCVGMLLSVMRMGGDSLPSRILKKIVAVYISFACSNGSEPFKPGVRHNRSEP